MNLFQKAGLVSLMILLSIAICPFLSYADSLKDAYKALKKIEMQAESGPDRRTYRDLVVDAKTEIELLPETGDITCISHLKRASYAYEIINEIWQSMQVSRATNISAGCVPVAKYDAWLKEFPALLTWKWGKTGVGVDPTNEAKSPSFDCCIIDMISFEMACAPCLFNEASLELNLAKQCLKNRLE